MFPTTLKADLELRDLLLTFYLDNSTSAELADWLKNIGQDARGSVAERRERVRAHTQYLTMPEAEFPGQTEHYLAVYSAVHLEDLCECLGLSMEGSKDALYRRIMREVHYKEGWLPRRQTSDLSSLAAAEVMRVLELVPLTKRGNYEKDFYPIISDELQEVFGAVYEQLPVAHGSTLKIDFHIGDPHGHGIGLEVKMPTNNSDVQRALGQLDQYQRRYGEHLLLFVLADFLKPEVAHFLREELKRKNVKAVFR